MTTISMPMNSCHHSMTTTKTSSLFQCAQRSAEAAREYAFLLTRKTVNSSYWHLAMLEHSLYLAFHDDNSEHFGLTKHLSTTAYRRVDRSYCVTLPQSLSCDQLNHYSVTAVVGAQYWLDFVFGEVLLQFTTPSTEPTNP